MRWVLVKNNAEGCSWTEREDFFRLKKVQDRKKVLDAEAAAARSQWAEKAEAEAQAAGAAPRAPVSDMLGGGDDDDLLIF